MSPSEVLWRHRTGRDGLVRADWSTDDGATWHRVVVKTKGTREKLRITELRIPDPTAKGLRELRLGALEQYLRQVGRDVTVRAPAARATASRGNVTIGGATARATASGQGGRVILKRPDKPRYGDEFYELFAEAYRDCVARGLPPRPTLADDAGVSRAAIARWTKEAVRRGHLTSAGMGKASV
jgi:hypothetical protein